MRVFLSGGMGNQLFQWAFAHFLHEATSSKISVIKIDSNSMVAHTGFDLSLFLSGCQHLEIERWPHKGLIDKLFSPYNSKLPFIRHLVWRDLADLTSKPFLGPESISFTQEKSYLGYFQNKDFVAKVIESVAPEILQSFFSRTSDTLYLDGEYEVVHVRRGDTASNYNKQRVGLLSRTYYASTLDESFDGKRYVISDDACVAREVMKHINYTEIMGPKSLDVIQSLQLMSRAKRVVAANSTLSWWGGLLASLKGAQVVIPSPFFKSVDLSTNGALDYLGFQLAKSYYEE